MTRTLQLVRSAAAVGAALLFLAGATAQPPSGGKKGADDNKKDTTREAPKSDPAVDAWVKVLGEKLSDKNDSVRDSARAALISIGQPAVPALKKLAIGEDATAKAAKSALAQIEGGSSGRDPGPRDNRGRPDTQPERPFGRGNFGGPATGLFDRLTRDLELTDKEKDKVKEIVSAQEKKLRDAMEKAREGGRPDFEKLRDATKTMREDIVKELKGVLSAEQLKKVERVLEGGTGFFGGSPGGRGPGGRGPGGPGGRGPGGAPDTPRTPETPPKSDPASSLLLAPALKDLDLTEKQKARVADLAAKHDKKVHELFDKATESKQRPDFEALGKLLAESMKEMKDVLTDEQFKKLEKAMTQSGSGGEAPRRREF